MTSKRSWLAVCIVMLIAWSTFAPQATGADHDLVGRLPGDAAAVLSVEDMPGWQAFAARYKLKDLPLPMPWPEGLPIERLAVGVPMNPLGATVIIELPRGKRLADVEAVLLKWLSAPPMRAKGQFVDFAGKRQLRLPGVMVSPTFGEVRDGDRSLVAVSMMPMMVDRALAEQDKGRMAEQAWFTTAWSDLDKRGLLKRKAVLLARGQSLRTVLPGGGPEPNVPGRPDPMMFIALRLLHVALGAEAMETAAVGLDLPGKPGDPIVIDKLVRFGKGSRGVPGFLLTCGPPRAKEPSVLDLLPVGTDVAFRLRPRDGTAVVKLVETIYAAIDPAIAEEFRTELAELSKDAGVQIEKSMLAAVGGDLGIGLHFPSLRSDPVLGLAAVLEKPDRFGADLARLIEFSGLEVDNRGGPGETVRVLKGRPLPVTLATRGRYFALATRPEVVAEIGRALDGKNRLVDTAAYRGLSKGLPVDRAVLWCAMDLGMVLDMAVGADRPDAPAEPSALLVATVVPEGPDTLRTRVHLDDNLVKKLLAVTEVGLLRMR